MKNTKIDVKQTMVIILMVLSIGFGGYAVYKKVAPKVENVYVEDKTFSDLYPKIEGENPFTFRTLNEVNSILENGSGIVYLGFPQCPWCQQYVVYLNEVAKDYSVSKIYYADILEDRQNNTEAYQKTVDLIGEYLQYDEEGKKRIYVPAIIAIYKGEIVGFDDETSLDTKGFDNPEEYWNEEAVANLKQRLEVMIINASQNICSDCNK